MPIPSLTMSAVTQALKELIPDLPQIQSGPHQSTKYDLLWRGHRFPPKVVVSRAAQIQYGKGLPESEFSGGKGHGQANTILKGFGFEIVSKQAGALPLQLHGRYTRQEIYGLEGIKYSPAKTRNLNVGLSPRCKDGGYFILVTLNKEQLDPAYDYPDKLFAEKFIWVTRRNVREDDKNYKALTERNRRVSLFVRREKSERFLYAGELQCMEHGPFNAGSDKPQLQFVWELKNPIPDPLLQELTLGVERKRKAPARRRTNLPRSRGPSSFDEFKRAFSYTLNSAPGRTVIPEHQHYQTHLNRFLLGKGITCEMERDFIDVTFTIDGIQFIGEIKVTRNLTLPQAFRAALGQILEAISKPSVTRS